MRVARGASAPHLARYATWNGANLNPHIGKALGRLAGRAKTRRVDSYVMPIRRLSTSGALFLPLLTARLGHLRWLGPPGAIGVPKPTTLNAPFGAQFALRPREGFAGLLEWRGGRDSNRWMVLIRRKLRLLNNR
jgi:hypothetical protein